jgi:hypothetical protein
MSARNKVGTGFSYRPASLHVLAELIPEPVFVNILRSQESIPSLAELIPGFLNIYKYGLWAP